jgi:phospholipase C
LFSRTSACFFNSHRSAFGNVIKLTTIQDEEKLEHLLAGFGAVGASCGALKMHMKQQSWGTHFYSQSTAGKLGRLSTGLLIITCLLFSHAAWAVHPVGTSEEVQSVSRPSRIQHIVIIFQENRTPDNLFHGLPHADIANGGFNSKGQYIPLTAVPLSVRYDLDHSHHGFLTMYDNGKMDGADKILVRCFTSQGCPSANPQFKYVNPSEVAPYFQMAEQYTFADRMFQTSQGPSFPAHQFIISGTSAPASISDLFASENVISLTHTSTGSNYAHAGCSAPTDNRVAMISPSGKESLMDYPCFEHPTLPDLLDAAGIEWRYYTVGDGWNALWNGPAAIRHLRFGRDWLRVVPKNTQILTDIASRRLAPVSWVIPSGQCSDHPGSNGCGPSWVAAIVNAIGKSVYWSNTAIFITWDDWGGWYDHVAPPIYNSYEYGFRVPLIVVSPYAKSHYVSHETHDFGSILRFIEEDFGLPSLGYADFRADDLSDCFDFRHAPLKFRTISAPLKGDYFLKDTTPATDPDDD